MGSVNGTSISVPPSNGAIVNRDDKGTTSEVYYLTPVEADIIDLFRQEIALLRNAPAGFEFSIDANPERMVSRFYQKQTCKQPRRARVSSSGHG